MADVDSIASQRRKPASTFDLRSSRGGVAPRRPPRTPTSLRTAMVRFISWHSSSASAEKRERTWASARWQFCRSTHSPASAAAAMTRSADAPWPCPRLRMCKREFAPRVSSLSRRSSRDGSAPAETKRHTGCSTLARLSASLRARDSGNAYSLPSSKVTRFCRRLMSLSGRSERMTQRRWKAVRRACHGSGKGTLSMLSASARSFHASGWSETCIARPEKGKRWSNSPRAGAEAPAAALPAWSADRSSAE
mmetsp:Transcript_26027/g.76287  ORF Transcript_26027/g.76287 Transcript_26027/m.76287 type:complete len:250 (-) Transcript_26027:5123-5872(-)